METENEQGVGEQLADEVIELGSKFAALHMSDSWHCVTSNAGPHGGACTRDEGVLIVAVLVVRSVDAAMSAINVGLGRITS
jgi:hypothetical protein